MISLAKACSPFINSYLVCLIQSVVFVLCKANLLYIYFIFMTINCYILATKYIYHI